MLPNRTENMVALSHLQPQYCHQYLTKVECAPKIKFDKTRRLPNRWTHKQCYRFWSLQGNSEKICQNFWRTSYIGNKKCVMYKNVWPTAGKWKLLSETDKENYKQNCRILGYCHDRPCLFEKKQKLLKSNEKYLKRVIKESTSNKEWLITRELQPKTTKTKLSYGSLPTEQNRRER